MHLKTARAAARTIMRHRDGILRWFNSKIANGLIEGINSLVQAAKAKARGYRSTRTIKAITYLIAANSTSDYPREIAESLLFSSAVGYIFFSFIVAAPWSNLP